MIPSASSSTNDDKPTDTARRCVARTILLSVAGFFGYIWCRGAFVRACGLFFLGMSWSFCRREGGWRDVPACWSRDWYAVFIWSLMWVPVLSLIDPSMKLLFPRDGRQNTLAGVLGGLENGSSGLGFFLFAFLYWTSFCLLVNLLFVAGLFVSAGKNRVSSRLGTQPRRTPAQLPLPLANRLSNLSRRHEDAIATLAANSSRLRSLEKSPSKVVPAFKAASAAAHRHVIALASTSTDLLEEAEVYLAARIINWGGGFAEQQVLMMLDVPLASHLRQRRRERRWAPMEMLEVAYLPRRWRSREHHPPAELFQHYWICLAPFFLWDILFYTWLIAGVPLPHSPPPVLVPLIDSLPLLSKACTRLRGQNTFEAMKMVMQTALSAVEVGRAEEQLREGVLDAVLWWKERKNEEEAAEW